MLTGDSVYTNVLTVKGSQKSNVQCLFLHVGKDPGGERVGIFTTSNLQKEMSMG